MKGIKKFLGGLLSACLALTSVVIYEPIDDVGIGDTVSAEATLPEGFDSTKWTVDTTIKSGTCFKLKNVHASNYTGKMYLEVADGANNYQVPLQQNEPSTNDPARNVFKFVSAGNGYYRILTTLPRDDDKEFALDVAGASKDPGAKILLWEKKTDGYFNNQLFKLIKHNTFNSYIIVTKVSNDAMVLDIDSEHSDENGANVVQNTLAFNGTQQWKLEEVDGVEAVEAAEGLTMDETVLYKFINKKTGKVMSVEGGNVAKDVNILAENDTGADYQKWELLKDKWNDYYVLNHKDHAYGFYVVRDGSPSNAVLKELRDIHVVDSYQETGMWIRFYKNADGTYRLRTQPQPFASYLGVESDDDIRDNTEFLTDDSQLWNIVTEPKPAETTTTTTTTTTSETTTTTTKATTTTTTRASSSTTTTTTRASSSTTTTTTKASTTTTTKASTTTTTAKTKESTTSTSEETTASKTTAATTTTETSATTATEASSTTAKTTEESTTAETTVTETETTVSTSKTKASTTAKTSKTTTSKTTKTTAKTTTAVTTTTKPEVKIDPKKLLRGDVDVNGVVELADVTTLSKYLLSASSYPLSCKEAEINSDVTYDDNISILDLSKLIEFNLGKITEDKL